MYEMVHLSRNEFCLPLFRGSPSQVRASAFAKVLVSVSKPGSAARR